MYLAFPSSEYYGASVLLPCLRPAVGLAFPTHWVRDQGEATSKEFPRSSVYRLAGWVPSYTPATSLQSNRSFPGASTTEIRAPPLRWRANSKSVSSVAYGPYPSALSRWTVKGLPTLVCLLHLSALLAGTSRLMVPGSSLRCQGCSRPTLHPQVGLPSASNDHCGDRQGGFSPPFGKTAPRGAVE